MKARRLLPVLLVVIVAAIFVRPETPAGPTGAWLRAADMEPRFETLGGTRVRYIRTGQGPVVILIHGLASSIFTWRDVIPALAREHDVVALDLPGFGGSDQPLDLSFSAYPGVVLGLMERLGIERASLVGNSLGGAVAVELAAQQPGRVERLVLIDSAGYNLSPADRPWLVRMAASEVAGLLIDRLPVRRTMVGLALGQVFHDPKHVTPERTNEYLAPLMRPGAPASMRSLLRSPPLASAAFAQEVSRVRAPTLVLWGRQDSWIPVGQADLFVAAIPGTRRVVIEACGHLPQEERPDETAALVLDFLGTPATHPRP